ncbi:MAG: hydantoinase B/oxoprolinase family protein [Deltaproteobacteria bacterium]|nr:hydantoinase B/oxoprolinase family protein [Deltaproteobacteria bacterium]
MIDPISLEVMRNALMSISDEMSAALVRTAYSTNIKDRRDCSCAIYRADGEVVAQSEIGTPLHLGVMPAVVRTVLKRFPIDSLAPGDAVFYNNPYPEGPGHLNDVTLVAPVFYKDRPVALLANQAHYVDVGGYAPGSMPFGVTEIFQVGLQVPPVRIIKKNKIDEEIFSILLENVRTKVEFKGDFMAQVAANNVGVGRLTELFEKHGVVNTLAHMDEIMNYSERRIRAGIQSLKDGVYSFEDYIEGDSISDDLIKIAVTVTISGDEVTADFSGTDSEVKGPINCRMASTAACVYYVIKCMADPGVPPNSGSYRPIKVIAPEGSLVNSNYPRSVVHSNIITTQRIVDCLLGALLDAAPERVMAAHHGTQNLINIGGFNSRAGRLFNYIETYGGGQGALYCQDGMDGVHSHMTNTRNAPVEVLETTYPLRINRYGLIPDSEGPGLYRGGMGMMREITILELEATMTISSDRNKIRPWGVLGGKAASPAGCALSDKNGKKLSLRSKDTRKVSEGDTIVTMTSGGGGWGNPHDRDPEKVRWDVLEGLVSNARAREIYGVALTGPEFTVDEDKTKRLRDQCH